MTKIIEDHLSTERLDLIPITQKACNIELSTDGSLSEYLKAIIPASWPPPLMTTETIYEFLDLLKTPEDIRLFAFYWVRDEQASQRERILIGSGGFFFRPDGTCELGYSVLDEFQNQGYATEAVSKLLDWAFFTLKVDRVVASTYPYLHASLQVLAKSGFTFIGKGEEEEILLFERRNKNIRSSSPINGDPCNSG
jgi:RimJ/RimL family protein N-acetyltransferase